MKNIRLPDDFVKSCNVAKKKKAGQMRKYSEN